jgi:hypothetical protein
MILTEVVRKSAASASHNTAAKVVDKFLDLKSLTPTKRTDKNAQNM